MSEATLEKGCQHFGVGVTLDHQVIQLAVKGTLTCLEGLFEVLEGVLLL